MIWFIAYCAVAVGGYIFSYRTLGYGWFMSGFFGILSSAAVIYAAYRIVDPRICLRQVKNDLAEGKNCEDIRTLIGGTFGSPPEMNDFDKARTVGFIAYIPFVMLFFRLIGFVVASNIGSMALALILAIPLAVVVALAAEKIASEKTLFNAVGAAVIESDRQAWEDMNKYWKRKKRRLLRDARFLKEQKRKIEAATKSRPSYKEFFEVPVEVSVGRCSDNQCPCDNTKIPRGMGYLYISRELVDFRRKCPSLEELQKIMANIQENMGGFALMTLGHGAVYPILMCEKAARLRSVDLNEAAQDAERWWRTGKVPLRPTPMRR